MTTDTCPICASRDLSQILRVDEAPVQVGTVWPTREAACGAPTGSIRLTVCRRCGFIFNRAFSQRAITYSPAYAIELHHSPTYQAYLEAEAKYLIEKYDIRHCSVLEVGCGSGHFLRLICSLGENDGYGFDPSLVEPRVEQLGNATLTLVNEFFDSSSEVPRVDLVINRSVLESIADPVRFLKPIREAIGDASDTVVYFEVPNASWVFGQHKTWNVYYEHCSYFTVDLLPRLFAAAGFRTVACEPCYDDDQHLRMEAKPSATPMESSASRTEELLDTMEAYRQSRERTIEEWREHLEALRAQGKRVAIWGAGGRGITFLNTVCRNPSESREHIAFAVDINPARQGRFLPRTGQEIVAPSALRTHPVDVVIITNPTYAPEIRDDARGMGVECSFLLA